MSDRSLRGFLSLDVLVVASTSLLAADLFVREGDDGTVYIQDRPAPGFVAYSIEPTPRASLIPSASTSRYDDLMVRAASRHSVPFSLLKAVIAVESGFRPEVVSSKGAMGLAQLMPATARELGVRNPFDPDESIDGAARYLARLLGDLSDETLAIAAYNAGPARVRVTRAVPDIPETRAYVEAVLSLRNSYEVGP
jgi:soluble lytic murein transglycosylase-like protein